MVKSSDHDFRLRVPLELKARIEQAATAGNRSINAEIVARLELSDTWLRQSENYLMTITRLDQTIEEKSRLLAFFNDVINRAARGDRFALERMVEIRAERESDVNVGRSAGDVVRPQVPVAPTKRRQRKVRK